MLARAGKIGMHVPVLLKEILEIFNPQPGQHFIDCTVGEGGHAKALLAKTAPDGKLLGIDRDSEIIKIAEENLKSFGSRILFIHDTYANLATICDLYHFPNPSGVLLDLGISSWHLEESGGGFSFKRDEALDMRFARRASGGEDPSFIDEEGATAADIVNTWREDDLAHIIEQFGEDRLAHTIAHAIVASRKQRRITKTQDLVEIIERAVGPRPEQRVHPATRTFQALRIVVNHELEALEQALPQAFNLLAVDGKLIVVSYHSLEDRIVKRFFRTKSEQGLAEILTKKPQVATQEEVMKNPRSRSAKLRALTKNDQ